nr:type IV toxin-antitoxin system AbiEi family antitoxin domain-containing protein [Halomonas sp.]
MLFDSEMVDTFNGLNTLRPRQLQVRLDGRRSVRAMRVFLVLARNAGHAWYQRLKPHQREQQRL